MFDGINASGQHGGRRPPITCIAVHDKTPELRVLYVSSSIREATQYEPSEIVGRPTLPFLASGNADDYRKLAEAQHHNNVVITSILGRPKPGYLLFVRVFHFNCDNIAVNLCVIDPNPIPESTEAEPLRIEVYNPRRDSCADGEPNPGHAEAQGIDSNSSLLGSLYRSSRVMHCARTMTKACLILEGSLTALDDEPAGPKVLFASNSFSRILDVDASDVQGLPFLALVATADTVAAARFLEKMAAPNGQMVLDSLQLLANPTPAVSADSAGEDQQAQRRVVTVEVLGAGSDDGAIILCQLERPARSRHRVADESDGYISLEDIISSDPETSDANDMWTTAELGTGLR
ncbi:hypothetical protein H4S02_002877 [Coemansia sp. RSA 2611]|nr:hypothetical protein H4S02_002877 [Coemansia sp. RSA 2611]